MALLDVRKEIDFCRKVSLPILGVVENMSGFVCPSCNHESVIWPATTGGAQKIANECNVPLLAKIPLDPSIGKACDTGLNPFQDDAPDTYKKASSVAMYKQVADQIMAAIATTKMDTD